MAISLRQAAATAVAGTLLAAAGVAAAAPASAAKDTSAPRIVSASLSEDSLTVPRTGVSKPTKFRVHVTDNVGVDGVVVGIFQGGELVLDAASNPYVFEVDRKSGTKRDGVYLGGWVHHRSEPVGRFTVRVVAYDAQANYSEDTKIGSFVSTYKTRVQTFDVTPDKADKGEDLTISGVLEHVQADGWDGMADRALTVQFRPAGSSSWKTKGSVSTDSDGAFENSTKFDASRDGSWRVTFAGNGKNAAVTSAGDRISVS